MSGFYHWQGTELVLQVKVNPRAAKDKIEPNEDRLKIKITTLPIDGKANKYLVKLLAKTFSVAPSKVIVERGRSQPLKTIRILQPATLPDFICYP